MGGRAECQLGGVYVLPRLAGGLSDRVEMASIVRQRGDRYIVTLGGRTALGRR